MKERCEDTMKTLKWPHLSHPDIEHSRNQIASRLEAIATRVEAIAIRPKVNIKHVRSLSGMQVSIKLSTFRTPLYE